MKKQLLFIIVFLFSGIIFSQIPTIQWKKTVGGTGNDFTRNIIQTADGGYITAGNTLSTDGDVTGAHGSFDFWIVKMDVTGAIEWQKALGGTGYDFAYSIQQTLDSGFIVVGWADSNNGDVTGNHGDTDFWIVKLNAIGTVEWQKSVGGTASDFAYAVHQNSDSTYVLVGKAYSNDGDVTGNHGMHDFWLVKLNATGNIIWQKTYGGSLNDFAYVVKPTIDKGYILVGNTNSTDGDVVGNHGIDDCWVVKLDSLGTIQWTKTIGGTGNDYGREVQQTTDQGYIIVGETASNDGDVSGNHGQTDCWILKLDTAGVIQWQKTLGGTGVDIGNSIQQTTDNGFIVAGWSDSNSGDLTSNHGASDYWLIKLDAQGNIFWQQSYGGTASDFAYSIKTTSDGGLIVAGNSSSNDIDVSGNHSTSHDFWIIKFNDLALSIPVNFANPSITVYPNPSSGQFNFSNLQPNSKIEIYDVTGRIVINTTSKNSNYSAELTEQSKGVYFYRIAGANFLSGKLIKY